MNEKEMSLPMMMVQTGIYPVQPPLLCQEGDGRKLRGISVRIKIIKLEEML